MSQQGVPRDTYTGRIEFKFSNIVKVRLPNQLPNFDTHDLAVDRTVICRSSEVMRKTFSNSQDNKATVTLARITPFDFTLYLNWLYTGILRTKCSQEDIAYGIDDEYESFIDGYLMGIELEDREYRNVMISALFEKAQELPRPDLPRPAWVNKVYDPNVASQEIVTLQYVLLEIFARCNDTASLYDAVVSRGELKDKIGFRSCDIVKVIVGSYVTTDVLVNRDLICRSSAIAREHLEDPDVKELRLGAIEITLVEVYLNWLYTGTLRTKTTSKQGEFHLLVRLYFLGIILKDVKFGNDIITAVVELAQEDSYPRELPGLECIRLAYTGFLGIPTSRAFKLRKTIVEVYARSEPSLLNEIKQLVRPSFLMELCARVMELRAEEVTSLNSMRISDFHDSVSNEGEGDGEPAARRRNEAEEPANKRRRGG
ncbi:hypothetical protein PRZ48_011955 [Zasmidium cellare]|uniref:BTB domain-containing protein n=1 Tax=Zasmidium cellare TaxID=395010 RepID=A0ABR0E852_ZASCE|nr:hypothetical protein PRZ48_011955 [Zasmidium cellare]